MADVMEGSVLSLMAARLSSVAAGSGLPSGLPRAPSAGLAACAARLPSANLIRRGARANSFRFALPKHAHSTFPRLPSVALGGLNGARGILLGKRLPAAGVVLTRKRRVHKWALCCLGPSWRVDLFRLCGPSGSTSFDAALPAIPAGASLIPKFRDHYVQTV